MISDEAVEAAAQEAFEWDFGVTDWSIIDAKEKKRYLDKTQAALEAAAPFIHAEALREAADAFENLPVNKGAEISSGTWDWFELFPIAHLRERADRLTQRPE